MGGALTAMCGLFNPAASNSYVNSVQQVSITIAASATSGTATISTVDTSRAFVIFNGMTTPSTTEGVNTIWADVTLTNSTTVTATRNTSSSNAIVVNAYIIDGKSTLVDSVQYGTVTTANTSVNATVTSVTTSQSACFWLGCTTTSAAGGGNTEIGRYYGSFVDLTSATTVNCTDDAFGSNRVTRFCLVQFASGALQSLQRISDNYTSANTTDTKTISAVTMANTMIAFGCGTRDNSANTVAYYYQLTSTTNVNLVRSSTNTQIRKPRYTVIEFVSGVFQSSAQRGAIALNNVTSNTATLSPAISSNAVVNFTGIRAPSGNLSTNGCALSYTNSTTVTANVNTAATSTVRDVGWESFGF